MDSNNEYTVDFYDETWNSKTITVEKGNVKVEELLNKGGYIPPNQFKVVELTHPGTALLNPDMEIELNPNNKRTLLVAKTNEPYEFVVDDSTYVYLFDKITIQRLYMITCIEEDKQLILKTDNDERPLKIDDEITSAELQAGKIVSMVKVWYQGKDFLMPKGKHTLNQIVERFKIPNGHIVQYIVLSQKELINFEDGFIDLSSETKFFSSVPTGGSSHDI